MASDAMDRSHVGFRGPSSIPLNKHHDTDTSLHVNQLQFNLQAPYSINSLASNFQKPQPLVIEKFPVPTRSNQPVRSEVRYKLPTPSLPASPGSSNRLHFAVQLAKIDAKRLWREQKELDGSENVKEANSEKNEEKQNTKAVKMNETRTLTQGGKRSNVGYVKYKSTREGDTKRNLRHEIHSRHFSPDPVEKPNSLRRRTNLPESEETQTREIRRLETQIQNYLQKLDNLIHKGQEVIQKKDKRLHVRRNVEDDVSHLSDEDTDPRQYERAEEQAMRSARVLYMIEKQIRELDDEIRKKGRNMKQAKKSQTLGRLAAAQRATVRALRMLINSAPLQPKRSQHYPSIYQALASLIQQLSLLSMQIDGGDSKTGASTKNTRFDDGWTRGSQDNVVPGSRLPRTENKLAFSQKPEDMHQPSSTYPQLIRKGFLDDSSLTNNPTPERNATLKAGLEALLREKDFKKKTTKPATKPPNAKKKAVLFPSSLQAKQQKAHSVVQKSVKFSNKTPHFTRETTASCLKKVEKPRITMKKEIRDGSKEKQSGIQPEVLELGNVSESGCGHVVDRQLHEHEIQRQLWLEDESRKRLSDVMTIPQHLVSEAEEAIKNKLKPLLDQAQAVVESSKTKPVQERFANIACKVTMQESEVLSDMILDHLLIDTAQEFQRLETNDKVQKESLPLPTIFTLENVLQRLQEFEKEEQRIRRNLNHVTYQMDQQPNTKSNEKPLCKPCRPSRTCGKLVEENNSLLAFIMPSEILDSIFSYQTKYSAYLNQSTAVDYEKFNPCTCVKKLCDNILEELLSDVAVEFSQACDDVSETMFRAEFLRA